MNLFAQLFITPTRKMTIHNLQFQYLLPLSTLVDNDSNLATDFMQNPATSLDWLHFVRLRVSRARAVDGQAQLD